MPQDDFNLISFKLLTYLYACLKRKIFFDEASFSAITEGVDEAYRNDVLYMLSEEGYIEGLDFIKAWGQNRLLANDLSEARITKKGIDFLTENSSMTKIKNIMLNHVGLFGDLVRLVLPK